jgi:hypothetical protein
LKAGEGDGKDLFYDIYLSTEVINKYKILPICENSLINTSEKQLLLE